MKIKVPLNKKIVYKQTVKPKSADVAATSQNAGPNPGSATIELKELKKEKKKKKLKEKLDSVIRLLTSSDSDIQHAYDVTRLSLKTFDELQDLHNLKKKDRFLLKAAAFLHDIGFTLSTEPHHKASLTIITTVKELILSKKERLIIGSVARYHRKAFPNKKHWHFAALKPEDQHKVRILSGILRIADGLDSGHRNTVKTVTCDFSDIAIFLNIIACRPTKKECDKTLQKAKLLEKVFRRSLHLRWHIHNKKPEATESFLPKQLSIVADPPIQEVMASPPAAYCGAVS